MWQEPCWNPTASGVRLRCASFSVHTQPAPQAGTHPPQSALLLHWSWQPQRQHGQPNSAVALSPFFSCSLHSHGVPLWTSTTHAPRESHSQRCPPWGKLISQLSKVSNPSTQRGRVRHIGDDINAAIPQGLIQIDPVCFSWKFQLISGMRFLSVMELGQVLYRPFSSRGN